MFQHFMRHVREENWFLLLKHLRRYTNARDFGSNLDGGRVRFSIELKDIQTFSVTAEDVEVGSMEATSVGHNVAQAVQHGFYRGLLSNRAGHVE
jgi:hypothetical protein